MKQIFSLLLAGSLLLLSGCKKQEKSYTATQLLMDTVVQITLQSGGSEAILNECFSLCRKYENLFSVTRPESDISRINAAGGKPVTVDPETIALLRLACTYSAESAGIFDLTVYPAKQLWDFESENPRLPDPAALASAIQKIDYANVQIHENTVTVSGGAEIDLGGIAKGYISDRLRVYLETQQVSAAVINLGGNVCCVGSKPNGFRVGIKAPYTADQILKTVQIQHGAVVTSGCYERYFTLNGKQYHHILDTATGYPIQNELAGVTIISEDSTLADFLSTTVYAMGYEKGLAFLEKQPAEAVFVFRNGDVRLSEGLTYADTETILQK